MGNWDIGDYMAAVFLFFYLGIPAFSIFTHRWFIMIDEDKTERKKAKDITRYWPLVREWLLFPDSKKYVPDHNPPDSHGQRWNAICILNSLLPEKYKMKDADCDNFKIIFQEYQKVLCHKFFDSHYLFFAHYTDYFSRKSRKIWNAKAIEEIWGGRTKENVFFLETWYDFLNIALDFSQLAEKDLYFHKDGKQFLSEFGKTAYKIYLSTLILREKLGYSSFSSDISYIESDIACGVTPEMKKAPGENQSTQNNASQQPKGKWHFLMETPDGEVMSVRQENMGEYLRQYGTPVEQTETENP